jgi:hypothetical protein
MSAYSLTLVITRLGEPPVKIKGKFMIVILIQYLSYKISRKVRPQFIYMNRNRNYIIYIKGIKYINLL